jgi:hypothetical protein
MIEKEASPVQFSHSSYSAAESGFFKNHGFPMHPNTRLSDSFDTQAEKNA